jgi:hypothetical protein
MQERLPTVDRCLQLSLGGAAPVWIDRDVGQPRASLGSSHLTMVSLLPCHCQTASSMQTPWSIASTHF